jgi:hypothetical protein
LLSTVGKTIPSVQVLSANALRSILPLTALDLATVETVLLGVERTFTVLTSGHLLKVDLQRTGRVVPLASAQAWTHTATGGRPTARLQFTDGSAVDLSEPGRTKRSTLELSAR